MPAPIVSRRDAVKLLVASWVVPAAFSACGRVTSGTTRPAPSGVPHLPRVIVSPERVIRTVVGLRPFRRPGFRLQADRLDEKTVIHNYGHGGGGMSLSWGSADLAARLALDTPHRRAAVLGCGVIGLTTARLLATSKT